VDGNRYVDWVMSWGPLILGHADPAVVSALEARFRRGTSYGAPCEEEVAMAEAVVARFPSIEKLRLTSSGTEAAMSAVRLARAATGRERLIKCDGCYHGHVDSLLVRSRLRPRHAGVGRQRRSAGRSGGRHHGRSVQRP
jgi:glutamate-1-semialdehyde 2,1-aminomutase